MESNENIDYLPKFAQTAFVTVTIARRIASERMIPIAVV